VTFYLSKPGYLNIFTVRNFRRGGLCHEKNLLWSAALSSRCLDHPVASSFAGAYGHAEAGRTFPVP